MSLDAAVHAPVPARRCPCVPQQTPGHQAATAPRGRRANTATVLRFAPDIIQATKISEDLLHVAVGKVVAEATGRFHLQAFGWQSRRRRGVDVCVGVMT